MGNIVSMHIIIIIIIINNVAKKGSNYKGKITWAI